MTAPSWRRESPKVAGWYWVSLDNGIDPEVVNVIAGPSGMTVRRVGSRNVASIGAMKIALPNHKWSGPLPPPDGGA